MAKLKPILPPTVIGGLLAALLLAFTAPARADFQDGLAAYDRGDYAAALEAWRPMAERGNAAAQWRLAGMYRRGESVPQDFAEAFRWHRLAAAQGLAVAQFHLGRMYEVGDGVQRDLLRAYAWYSLAAARYAPGHDREVSAGHRDRIGRRLSPQKLARAQQLAGRWHDDPASLGLTAAPQPPQGLVARIQRGLSALGYRPGPIDDILGPRTRAAIRAFQADHGLPVTGQVSENLANELPVARAAKRRSAEPRKLRKAEAGTGFAVSGDGHVLTNHHLVAGCREVRVAPDGLAEPVGDDAGNDLALLRVSRKFPEPATFRAGAGVRQGDEVVVAGFPLRGLLSSGLGVTTGTVSALAGPGDNRRILQISAPVQPGNSGGPVLDLSGNVVGVVAMKLDAMEVARRTGAIPQNVNFAVGALAARALLEAHKVAHATAPSTQALTPADVAERARAFTVPIECWR